MSRLCRFLIIFIAVYAAAGCFSPIGSIGGSDTVDLLWVVPNRLEYKAGEIFLPGRDLEVFALSDGVVKAVHLSQVEIGIADATLSDDLKNVLYDSGCVLEPAGKKLIVVKYGGASTSYYIEVLDSDGNVNNTKPGINIEWDLGENEPGNKPR